MKKTIILLSVLVFGYALSFSQNKSEKADVLWGPELKESKKSTLSDIIGHDETGIYTLKINRKGRNKLILEHLDNEMTPSKSVELELKEQKKERNLEFIIQLDGELYLFSSFKNQKLKKNFLFVQGIDKKTLQLKKPITKIAEIPYVKRSRFNAGSFGHELSGDKSKVLIYYNLPYDKGGNEKFGFHIFNNDFQQLWEKKVTLPYKEELFTIEDYEISDNGDVYLLGVNYKEKRKSKRKGKPNYNYHILGYS